MDWSSRRHAMIRATGLKTSSTSTPVCSILFYLSSLLHHSAQASSSTEVIVMIPWTLLPLVGKVLLPRAFPVCAMSSSTTSSKGRLSTCGKALGQTGGWKEQWRLPIKLGYFEEEVALWEMQGLIYPLPSPYFVSQACCFPWVRRLAGR